jgi:hypothetical protein
MRDFSNSSARFAIWTGTEFPFAHDHLPGSETYRISEVLEWRAQWLTSFARVVDAPINSGRLRGAFLTVQAHMLEFWNSGLFRDDLAPDGNIRHNTTTQRHALRFEIFLPTSWVVLCLWHKSLMQELLAAAIR